MNDKLDNTIVTPIKGDIISVDPAKAGRADNTAPSSAKSKSQTGSSQGKKAGGSQGKKAGGSQAKKAGGSQAKHAKKADDSQTDHTPRPIKPEDESYGDLMLRFTAHPVKPKYWFEEFGDHWTCSCGQINKGDSCTNCGLERELLRKLFILHKPSADGTPSGQGTEGASVSGDDTVALSGIGGGIGSGAGKAGGFGKAGSTGHSSETRTPDHRDEYFDKDRSAGSHSRLLTGIIILILLLLMGTGAFLYFVVLPEMQEQEDARRDSVRISLTEHLPVATVSLPRAQYAAYIAAGDMLVKREKYYKSLNYYNKAAALKDDESVRQKMLDAKFGYVKAHLDDDGEYLETFLNELVEAHYDGAQTIYDQYYAWHVNIIANNLEDDFSTDMKNVNIHDTVFFHTTVTGGAPNDTVRFYYQIIWPDGTSEKKDIKSSWHAGSHFSSRFQYAMPILSKAGKLTFELYDKDSHDLLGSDSIKLKK